MKKTMWKFPLNLSEANEIEMPQGSDILSVTTQVMGLGRPIAVMVWAAVPLCAEREVKETRVLYVVSAGHEVPEQAVKFIGAVVVNSMVLHVFEGPTL